MLEDGTEFFSGKKYPKVCKKCLAKTSLVMSILERKGSLVGSLMPWGSEQLLLYLGCSAMWQILLADPVQFSKFKVRFPPRVQHIRLAVNS